MGTILVVTDIECIHQSRIFYLTVQNLEQTLEQNLEQLGADKRAYKNAVKKKKNLFKVGKVG